MVADRQPLGPVVRWSVAEPQLRDKRFVYALAAAHEPTPRLVLLPKQPEALAQQPGLPQLPSKRVARVELLEPRPLHRGEHQLEARVQLLLRREFCADVTQVVRLKQTGPEPAPAELV